ncbi:hypothetical protein [uncultured Sphingomonas sp.]|jgi:hypothetical protein|uniref:hypothetical protein n=1 Tax=unclassified Sphingomonas TaxID=196159 RepID=UPI0025EFBBD8|nr:hypothetical protein [uncultured Sphingomonas sp.]
MTVTLRQIAPVSDVTILPFEEYAPTCAETDAQDYSVEDKEYFYKRAESELEMAQRTIVPEAVKAHYTLAGYYLDKVYNDDQAPAANDAGPALGNASGS